MTDEAIIWHCINRMKVMFLQLHLVTSQKDVPEGSRNAVFKCAITLGFSFRNTPIEIYEGDMKGYILVEPGRTCHISHCLTARSTQNQGLSIRVPLCYH